MGGDLDPGCDLGFPIHDGSPFCSGGAMPLESAFVPACQSVDPATFEQQFYEKGDDLQITGAVAFLHPMLAQGCSIPLGYPVQHPPGTVLFELHGPDTQKGALPPAVHLILWGRAKLIEVRDKTQREIGLCRCGQLVGMPELLRAYHARVPEASRPAWRWPEDLVLKVVAIETMSTQPATIDEWLAAIDKTPELLCFVENQVAVRFGRRKELQSLAIDAPLMRLVGPADAEYMMGLAALRSAPDDKPITYLQAGKPGSRVALVLKGEAILYVPSGSGGSERYVATLGPGQLFGHEGLVMAGEDKPDGGDGPVPLLEPPRHTEVRLAPGTQILEFYWYGFRWAMDDKKPVWDRATRIMSGRCNGAAEPLPTVAHFIGTKTGLGTSVLAYATAVVLAKQLDEDPKAPRCAPGKRAAVQVIDLQGRANFEKYWQALGFTLGEARTEQLQAASRRTRASRPEQDIQVTYMPLLPPMGRDSPLAGIDVIWPDKVDAAERLIDLLRADDRVRFILLGGDLTAEVQSLCRAMDFGADAIFRVTDDTRDVYDKDVAERNTDLTIEDPPTLTWVYRMTDAYVQRERKRSEWSWIPFADRFRPTATDAATVEAQSGKALIRRTVRVPHHKGFDLRKVGELVKSGKVKELPMVRAAERLARVIQRKTVGLALGGGGAWGFAHVALIENLEKTGVPIDYISGTSFGSVVGGMYAGGGMKALHDLVEENSQNGTGLWATTKAIATGPLNRILLVGAFQSAPFQWLIDYQLAGGWSFVREPPVLGITEIPFYPVGTNLYGHEEVTGFPATIGYGVRLSGAMPPVFGAISRDGEPVVDGAMIANVPARVVRRAGADFVIASNVVVAPKSTTPSDPSVLLEPIRRVQHLLTGLFVLIWKAGQDQGKLSADETLDFRPKGVEFWETWKGRDVVDDIRKYFENGNQDRLLKSWRASARRLSSRWTTG